MPSFWGELVRHLKRFFIDVCLQWELMDLALSATGRLGRLEPIERHVVGFGLFMAFVGSYKNIEYCQSYPLIAFSNSANLFLVSL